MEAFIPAAGLGTRLKPLTDDRPKALVTVGDKTLLEIAIGRVAEAGATRCIVNVHYFGDMLIDYISSRQWPCEVAVSDERDMLLDTGGALKHAAPLFSGREPVLVHNVDVISDIDFRKLLDTHTASNNLATLCVSQRHTERPLAFDSDGLLIGRAGDTGVDNSNPMAFSGITMISPQLFPLLPSDSAPYPIIPCYIALAKEHRIASFRHSPENWLDVGTPQKLERAKAALSRSEHSLI